MPRDLQEIMEIKQEIRDRLSQKLSKREMNEALRDHHARRRPRPCGLTIHTGIGCPLRCTYCYIYDMGFGITVKPYPLKPEQLVYALVSNPYFIPGHDGTLIALGSVTEPFLPQTKELTIGYIDAISTYLGNPIQFSTKMYMDKRNARRIADLDPGISPLITIITIKHRSKLEPYAPSPELRFKTIENLAEAGLKPILFYRPIIPGIADKEHVDILMKAKHAGAIGVVAGGLRITENILRRLHEKGIPIDEIVRRSLQPIRGRKQVPIKTSDIKKNIMKTATSLGMKYFLQACMANIYTHGAYCFRMVKEHIVSEPYRLPAPSEIRDILGEAGLELLDTRIAGYTLIVYARGVCSKTKKFLLEELIKYKYRICVSIKLEKTCFTLI